MAPPHHHLASGPLYLSCESVALSPFWVHLAFRTGHTYREPNPCDDATAEKETIGYNSYITDIIIYSSL